MFTSILYKRKMYKNAWRYVYPCIFILSCFSYYSLDLIFTGSVNDWDTFVAKSFFLFLIPNQGIFLYWRNHIPVLAKSYTGIDKIIYRYWWNCIPRKLVGPFPVPVYDFAITSIWFRHYRYTISPIPVYNFVNFGIRFKYVGNRF